MNIAQNGTSSEKDRLWCALEKFQENSDFPEISHGNSGETPRAIIFRASAEMLLRTNEGAGVVQGLANSLEIREATASLAENDPIVSHYERVVKFISSKRRREETA